MADKFILFDWSVNYYNSSQTIEVIQGCNCLTITNTGADNVRVKGKILYPGTAGSILGDSISIGGNECEIFNERRLQISFETTTNPQVEVIQKYYLL
jgi:hypothetical protein